MKTLWCQFTVPVRLKVHPDLPVTALRTAREWKAAIQAARAEVKRVGATRVKELPRPAGVYKVWFVGPYRCIVQYGVASLDDFGEMGYWRGRVDVLYKAKQQPKRTK